MLLCGVKAQRCCHGGFNNSNLCLIKTSKDENEWCEGGHVEMSYKTSTKAPPTP